MKCLKWVVALAAAVALCGVPVLATAAPDPPEVPHTITWWCVDLNTLLHVNVPIITARINLQPPDPSPIPDPCWSPWPVAVPQGSQFASFALWFTNKTYPPAVRAALEEMGYNFHSQSPAEDLMSKFVEIRAEVRTYPAPGEVVAEYRFDPRQNFRLVRLRQFWAGIVDYWIGPIVNPDVGVDLSVEEVGRLPLLVFPVVVGPLPTLPPGDYYVRTYWTLSADHNDGTCLDDACWLPAGELYYSGIRFTLVP